jgi:SAM-dependent methyltransferase
MPEGRGSGPSWRRNSPTARADPVRPRIPVAIALATGLAIWRRPDVAIRVVRWLDQRSGIDGPAGARIYDAVLAPLAGWLYERIAADLAATLTGNAEPAIVDIGTGPGLLLIEIAARCPTATIVGVDPAEPMRAAAHRRLAEAGHGDRVTVIDGAAERLPFEDTSIDLVVSSLASHHWSHPAAAFREVARVLRPGGRALIYDLRFAGFLDRELDALAGPAGIERAAITREVLRGGPMRLFTRVTLTMPGTQPTLSTWTEG